MTSHHLAQFNVGRTITPLDAPEMAEFVRLLVPVNARADEAPGFVWRLTDDDGADATGVRPLGADMVVNLSVWESREALWNYVYRSGHLEVMRRRREWFHHMAELQHVLWWIPAGHIPTVGEAIERLELLRVNGSAPPAFTFREPHEPDVVVG